MKKSISLLMLLAMFTLTKTKAQCIVDAGPNMSFCCPGGTDSIMATFFDTLCPCPNTTYQWSPTTGLSNPNILNPVVTASSTRWYTLCVTKYRKSGCAGICCQVCDSVKVTVSNLCCKISGIESQSSTVSNVKLYPNPAKNILMVEIKQDLKNAELAMYDVEGKLVWKRSNINEKSTAEINVGFLPRGVYFVKLREGNNEIQNTKVVLE